MGMGRRSRSPNASSCEAPAEKMARTAESDETSSTSNSHNDSSKLNYSNSSDGVYSTTPLEATVISTSPTGALITAQTGAPKVKRQDWCRWPICKAFYRTGCCPNDKLNEEGGTLCSLAHIREGDGVSETADGYVRICFDSMGLIQPACRRAKCSYFHPPKHIREMIIARRHSQYLQEKNAKMLRNQMMQSAAFMQQINPAAATTATMNPYVFFPEVLPNLSLNQIMLCNGYALPDVASASLLPPAKANSSCNGTDAVKVPVNVDPSLIYCSHILPSTTVMSPVNWADYMAKMNTQVFQQRPDAIQQPYNWLPVAPINAALFGPLVAPQAAAAAAAATNPLALQQLGAAINPMASSIAVPQATVATGVMACGVQANVPPVAATKDLQSERY